MPVNIEIKGNLARLLATENLIIEHKKVDTASFDVERRILTLPQWKLDSNYVYDMLVAHEVGHALHTPFRRWNEEPEYKDVPMDYVNVVEDARIEKLMKQRFAGLNKDFYKAYEELHASNFFEVEGEDIDSMRLIDKVNLYFKIGAYLCINFNDEENQLITEISQAETFDQVLDLSKKLYEMSKSDQQEALAQLLKVKATTGSGSGQGVSIGKSQEETDQTQDETDGNVETPTDQSENGQNSNVSNKTQDETQDQDEDEDAKTQGIKNKAGNHADITESQTQRSFDGNVQELNDVTATETTYLNIPELNTDTFEVEFNTIQKALATHFTLKDGFDRNDEWFNEQVTNCINEYNIHKRSSTKDVNNLVKEFEMKKSADSYSRSATSRTGMLDMTQLHTYKYNDDIFKKVTTIPEGKNHGLVFLLDWSGSMHYQLNDTIKQLFNLVWFCRKVNIPFEVYAFTNDSYCLDTRANTRRIDDRGYMTSGTHHNPNLNDICIEGTFRMVNILSSTAKSRDLDEMMKLIWLQTQAISGHYINPAREFMLSGTPLNEAIISSELLVKRLIARESLQKCHVIVLTDGDGYHTNMVGFRQRYNHTQDCWEYDTTETTHRSICPKSSVIRVGSKTFNGGSTASDFTCNLVKAVKSRLPNTTFLAIRILERDYHHFYMSYARKSYETFEDMKKQNKKEGIITFKSDSFDQWFAISSNKLRTEDDLAVDQGADKRAVSTAFKKMNRGKKTNRVMVKQFIDRIA